MSEEWLQLDGCVYSCAAQYVGIDELDPLAELFMKTIELGENDVDRLIKELGLAARVVEDILGELVHRNRAILAVKDGKASLSPLKRSQVTRQVVRESDLEVWQETTTGLVLPFPMVRELLSRQSGTLHRLPLRADMELISSFEDAPDAVLIETLLRCSPEIGHEGSALTLDRLAGRFRVRPVRIYLRVHRTIQQGRQSLQLDHHELPPWVLRVWSVALNSDSEPRADADEAPAVDALLAGGQDAGAEVATLVHGWRLTSLMNRWREQVENLLHMRPPPLSGHDLRSLMPRRADLFGGLCAVANVELRRPEEPATSWITPCCRQANRWLVCVVPDPKCIAALVSDLIEVSKTLKEGLPPELFLLAPGYPGISGTDSTAPLNALTPAPRVHTANIRWPPGAPWMTLNDLGYVALRRSGQQAHLSLEGNSIASDLLGVVQSETVATRQRETDGSLDPTAHLLRALRVSRANGGELRRARFAGTDSNPLDIINTVSQYEADLLTAVVDPTRYPADAAAKEPTVRREIDNRALADRAPKLVEQLVDVCEPLLQPLSGGWALARRIVGSELPTTFAAILSDIEHRHTEGQVLVFPGAGTSEVGALVDWLYPIVERSGWSATIALDPTSPMDPVIDAMQRNRNRPRAARLRVVKLTNPAPLFCIVFEDLVFISATPWGEAWTRRHENAGTFGLAMESGSLASDFRDLCTGGREVTAP